MKSIDKEYLKFFDQGSDFLKIFEKQMKTFFGDAFRLPKASLKYPLSSRSQVCRILIICLVLIKK